MFRWDFDEERRIIKDDISEEQLLELYKEYMETYHDFIDEEYSSQMDVQYNIGMKDDEAPCYLMQFYDEYNLIKDEYNIYKAFIELIKHDHPDLSNMTILDVGGGIVPSLGRRIAKEAKHVIVIDRDLANIKNPNNLETIRKEITSEKDLPNADLIVGFMPCETTDYIIDHACKTKTDFLIELCGCIHDEELRKALSYYPDYFYYYSKQYQEDRKKRIIELIKQNDLGLYSEYGCSVAMPYKVVGNKRVK